MSSVWPYNFVHGVVFFKVFMVLFLFVFFLSFYVLRVLGIGWEREKEMELRGDE